MGTIAFEWDSRDLSVWRNRGVDKALLKALTKAGGDAARAMKVESSRSVRARKRFKLSKVNKSLPLTFPKGKQSIESLEWRLDASGAPMPMSELPYTQVAQGVSVAFNGSGRHLFKSAFVATMRSGHKGIFRRVGKARLPIDELFTARVSDVLQNDGLIPTVFERTQKVFKSSFDRLFPLELEKLAR